METLIGYIRYPSDAILVLEACRLGRLQCVKRRLSDSERAAYVKSGTIFVWDEDDSGIKRWTDSRHWSPSRINGVFLIYREVEPTRAKAIGSNGSVTTVPDSTEFVVKENGLTKKALSIQTRDGRKQHLVCYYTRDDVRASRYPPPTEHPACQGIEPNSMLYPALAAWTSEGSRVSAAAAASTSASASASASTATAAVPAATNPAPASALATVPIATSSSSPTASVTTTTVAATAALPASAATTASVTSQYPAAVVAAYVPAAAHASAPPLVKEEPGMPPHPHVLTHAAAAPHTHHRPDDRPVPAMPASETVTMKRYPAQPPYLHPPPSHDPHAYSGMAPGHAPPSAAQAYGAPSARASPYGAHAAEGMDVPMHAMPAPAAEFDEPSASKPPAHHPRHGPLGAAAASSATSSSSGSSWANPFARRRPRQASHPVLSPGVLLPLAGAMTALAGQPMLAHAHAQAHAHHQAQQQQQQQQQQQHPYQAQYAHQAQHQHQHQHPSHESLAAGGPPASGHPAPMPPAQAGYATPDGYLTSAYPAYTAPYGRALPVDGGYPPASHHPSAPPAADAPHAKPVLSHPAPHALTYGASPAATDPVGPYAMSDVPGQAAGANDHHDGSVLPSFISSTFVTAAAVTAATAAASPAAATSIHRRDRFLPPPAPHPGSAGADLMAAGELAPMEDAKSVASPAHSMTGTGANAATGAAATAGAASSSSTGLWARPRLRHRGNSSGASGSASANALTAPSISRNSGSSSNSGGGGSSNRSAYSALGMLAQRATPVFLAHASWTPSVQHAHADASVMRRLMGFRTGASRTCARASTTPGSGGSPAGSAALGGRWRPGGSVRRDTATAASPSAAAVAPSAITGEPPSVGRARSASSSLPFSMDEAVRHASSDSNEMPRPMLPPASPAAAPSAVGPGTPVDDDAETTDGGRASGPTGPPSTSQDSVMLMTETPLSSPRGSLTLLAPSIAEPPFPSKGHALRRYYTAPPVFEIRGAPDAGLDAGAAGVAGAAAPASLPNHHLPGIHVSSPAPLTPEATMRDAYVPDAFRNAPETVAFPNSTTKAAPSSYRSVDGTSSVSLAAPGSGSGLRDELVPPPRRLSISSVATATTATTAETVTTLATVTLPTAAAGGCAPTALYDASGYPAPAGSHPMALPPQPSVGASQQQQQQAYVPSYDMASAYDDAISIQQQQQHQQPPPQAMQMDPPPPHAHVVSGGYAAVSPAPVATAVPCNPPYDAEYLANGVRGRWGSWR